MSIKENLDKARQAMAIDIAKGANGTGLADEVREAGVAAVTHGIESEDGRKYMALFCDTPNELLQMTVVRSTDESYMPQMRSYAAADAVCQPITNNLFAVRVDKNIEPPSGSSAPQGSTEPSAIRDNGLAARLRAV